jgi:hypothetical protein
MELPCRTGLIGWVSAAMTDDPSAFAGFGVYRDHPRRIFRKQQPTDGSLATPREFGVDTHLPKAATIVSNPGSLPVDSPARLLANEGCQR